jgi:hypothetical protein
MTTTTVVNHDLRCVNGCTIWLPPNIQDGDLVNMTLPDIRSYDTAQVYPIGTRMTTDERTFRYCLADTAAISHCNRGAGNNNRHMEGDAIGNAVAGAYTLNWRISDCDYASTVAYTTENTYEGGYIWIMNSDASLWEFHKIIKNAAATGSTAATDYVTLTFADPITTASTTPWCTAYRNIYSDVRMEVSSGIPSNDMPVVCVPHIKAAVDTYFWGQTWGPMWTTAVSTPPNDAYRELVWHPTGVIARLAGDYDPSTYGLQRAGYMLTYTLNTGDMMYMLTLAP